jgi:hypothetical protein
LALAIALSMNVRMIPGFHAVAQASLVFLLLHSLRWRDAEHSGTPMLRWLAALAWMGDAWVWTRELRWEGILFVGSAAIVVLAAWLWAWRLRRERPSLVLPVAATVALCSGPGNWLVRHGSDGLVALLGSLILFAAGLIMAWTRHRWEGKEKSGRS